VATTVLALFAAFAATATFAVPENGDAANTAYGKVVAALLADTYARNPTFATDLGLHDYDARLEDYSAAAVQREDEAIAKFEAQLQKVDPSTLTEVNAQDREYLLHVLMSQRIRNDDVRQ